MNPDCIRDILLYLEENIKIEDNNKFTKVFLAQIQQNLSSYSDDEICYNSYILEQGKYIRCKSKTTNERHIIIYINDITILGHEFLNTVRPDAVWDSAKKKAARVGVASLKILLESAVEATIEHIKNPQLFT